MYSKSGSPRIVQVTLKFEPELEQDAYVFALRRATRRQKDSEDQLTAVGATMDPVDWLASMLVEPPGGFEDFPVDERPLEVRVRSYFLDADHPELIDIASWVRERYFRIVLPTFLFR